MHDQSPQWTTRLYKKYKNVINKNQDHHYKKLIIKHTRNIKVRNRTHNNMKIKKFMTTLRAFHKCAMHGGELRATAVVVVADVGCIINQTSANVHNQTSARNIKGIKTFRIKHPTKS